MAKDEVLTRVPPQAVEVERAVLGAMLLEKEAIPKVLEILDEDCFYLDSHRKIFSAIVDLFERNEPADDHTLLEELRRRKELDKVGGAAYLAQLATEVATAANVEYHAKIVLEKALLRKLITLCTQTIEECYAGTEDVFDLVDRAEQRIFNISARRLKGGFVQLSSVLHDTFETIERMHLRPGVSPGAVRTGFHKLDEMTAGFQPSDLIIVAGRPSMGKTSFVLNVARNAAVEQKVQC